MLGPRPDLGYNHIKEIFQSVEAMQAKDLEWKKKKATTKARKATISIDIGHM